MTNKENLWVVVESNEDSSDYCYTEYWIVLADTAKKAEMIYRKATGYCGYLCSYRLKFGADSTVDNEAGKYLAFVANYNR